MRHLQRAVLATKCESRFNVDCWDDTCSHCLFLYRALTTSFSVLRGQIEGHFDLSASEIDNLRYSDMEEKCHRAIGGDCSRRVGSGDRIFVVVSPAEALRLRLIRSETDQPSCNLALIEPWTTGISTTMQELLIKDSFRQSKQREGKIRLYVLEIDQSLPSHVCASRDFWSGWSNLPANRGDYKSLSIVIQCGAAPVVPSRSLSRKSASLRISSRLSRTSSSKEASQHLQSPLSKIEAGTDTEEKKKEDEQEGQGESQQSPSHSLLPLQASHFSSETNAEDRAKDDSWDRKLAQVSGKRSKRGVRLPTLTEAALAFRASNVSCFKSGTVSPRVTSTLLQARRDKRASRHPISPLHTRTASMAWRKKRNDMTLDTTLPLGASKIGLSTSRTGIGGSFKRSNRALKRAAGYFGSRASVSVRTSEPPTPTTASISLAEMCSHLAESSVENLLCKESRTESDSLDWRDTMAETTVEQDEKEIIGSPSIEVASICSKRKGWLGNGSQIPAITESCDMEDDSQEIEIRPAKQRETIILEDTFGKKARVEEEEEELYELPKRAIRRSESITSLFKSALSSLAASPQKSPPRKNKWLGYALKEQVHKLARSKSVSGEEEERQKSLLTIFMLTIFVVM